MEQATSQNMLVYKADIRRTPRAVFKFYTSQTPVKLEDMQYDHLYEFPTDSVVIVIVR